MPKAAYYNEYEPFAAQWLRNLIAAGHIAPGDVDTRSIVDVRPSDLRGFTQCHFFAGIGVWSLALRRAGWPDSRPVWTGSCPCQPFSSAGQGSGFADERHLWPSFFHLIKECDASIVFGEQVASKDADPWLDLVQTDMEGLGHAFGAVAFPAAGVGAPHLRDRTYWASIGLAHPPSVRLDRGTRCAQEGGRQLREQVSLSGGALPACGLAHTLGGIDIASGARPDQRAMAGGDGALSAARPAGPTHSVWADADWLFCRDGKWRPVSPLPQPLVDGSSESLGRVRPEVIAKIEEEVNATTSQSKGIRAAAMRSLLENLGAQAKRCWAAGGLPGLHEAPFLLAFMRQLQEQGWRVAERLSVPRAETFDPRLRGLRNRNEAASAPRQHGLEGQQAGEHPDLVSVLSSLLACAARETWGDAYAAHAEVGFPLAHQIANRVGRLRAYGNAIVAPQAQAWIETVMECMP